MNTLVKILCVISALCFGANIANAEQHKQQMSKKQHGAITMLVQNAWARALPEVATNGAAYLMLQNGGRQDEQLLSMSSPIAQHVMLHQSVVEQGMMQMQHVDKLPIKAGQSVLFKPGAYHIMLMGLKKPLQAGQSFMITLHFLHSASIDVIVQIKQDN